MDRSESISYLIAVEVKDEVIEVTFRSWTVPIGFVDFDRQVMSQFLNDFVFFVTNWKSFKLRSIAQYFNQSTHFCFG
jgi:Ser/Thr protein kinase RdoA (MazF antagonist)